MSDKEIKIRCLELAKASAVDTAEMVLKVAKEYWDFCCNASS